MAASTIHDPRPPPISSAAVTKAIKGNGGRQTQLEIYLNASSDEQD